MRILKGQTPEEKESRLAKERAFIDRRVKQYMEGKKLEQFNAPPAEFFLTEEQLGPDSFHQFHPEDRDQDERTVHTNMEAFVKETLQKIWQADPSQINAIVAPSLQLMKNSIEATQIFMAAYKRLEEKHLLNQTAGIYEANLELLDKLNSAQVAELFDDDDRNEILDGIRDFLEGFQYKATPILKGVKTNDDVNEILYEMIAIGRAAKQRHKNIGDEAANLDETIHAEKIISTELQRSDILHLLTAAEKRRFLKLEEQLEKVTKPQGTKHQSSAESHKMTTNSSSSDEEEASLRLARELQDSENQSRYGKRSRKPTERLHAYKFGPATESYTSVRPNPTRDSNSPPDMSEYSLDDDSSSHSSHDSSSKRRKKLRG